ncbi:single-strand binding protein family [Streptococcus pneumoniae]|uniref:single-stranded DNA-binding protein n=5 Tax=Streptococcus pneumoniae TaxID=1313 RepID=UPI0007657B91|nr:single-stranded DNA-binding protein [Streptococcus pneumoniae]CVS43506.1 single-strand binding protein family [Streptococcus pneumoniae]CVZ55140.1 single-strand binding protein family [Streptococcus pneumoniae]VLT76678.1 single-strand binding protein family [Streptococcus pneumoniae]HES9910528.1 single-stranded DNA-binding protein [Streptococcus pneumoniae]HET0094026.1 single-stranded DNA-binding protein [Streptococcus pneumoniae]
MINNVTLVGRLVAPPDLRKTPNNVSSLQGTLAVNRNFKNENGEREADFINFQAWRGTADIIAQYCSKGSLIGIIGRLQVRSYEKDGQRRYVTEVIAESVALLESRNSQHGQGNSFQNGNSYGQQGSFVEGNTTNLVPDFTRDNNPFGRPTNPLDISDDDLPF